MNDREIPIANRIAVEARQRTFETYPFPDREDLIMQTCIVLGEELAGALARLEAAEARIHALEEQVIR
jgi:hypothetical protein